MLNRRQFLAATAATASVSFMPGAALAATPTDPRFMFIFLRGGMDGLGAVPVPGDADYQSYRPDISVSPDDALTLDSTFALHPNLANVHDMFQTEEAIIFQGVAGANRDRSHFEAMRQLEQGGETLDSLNTGWLGRATSLLFPDSDSAGLALSQSLPVSFVGSTNVLTWAPSYLPEAPKRFLSYLDVLYRNSGPLDTALKQGRDADDIASTPVIVSGDSGMGGQAYPSGSPQSLAQSAGQFLALDDGPRIGMMDLGGGWDTHAGQDTDLGGMLTMLDETLGAFKDSIGSAWQYTSMFVISEFGRTVEENGTNGTDHGTGGAAFLLGGAVSGGRVIAENWAGLERDALFEERDLPPNTDARSILKGVMTDHMGLSATDMENDVFPLSEHASKMDGLIR